MNISQRQLVMAIVAAAGAAGLALACCPPEEGTPVPAQETELSNDVIIRSAPGMTITRRVTTFPAHARGAEANYLIELNDQPGSTLETRVYKPGEAMSRFNMRFAGDGPVRFLRVKENGHDISVEQRGEKITAKIDGKDAPQSAVTVKNGTIEVRDEKGNTLLKEPWPDLEPADAITVPGVPTIVPMPTVPGVTWTGPDGEEAPKVMLGITMNTADEDVVQQLGLPDGEYAVIESVPEGLPAAKAGLQPKDIIVSIDGQHADGPGAIREIMKDKKPGDTLAVEVVRKGARVKTNVSLEAFDGRRFKAYGQAMTLPQADGWEQKYGEQMKRLSQDLQERMKSAGDAKGRLDTERLHNQMIAIARGNGEPMLLATTGEAQAKLEERLAKLESQLARLEDVLRRIEDKTGAPIAPPTPPSPPAPPSGGGGGGAPKPYFAMGI